MAEDVARFTVSIGSGPDLDREEVAELGQQLRKELLAADEVASVDPVRGGAAPSGAKGDPITLAALAVTVAPAAVQGLIALIQSWLTRHERATVTVESGGEKITVTGQPSPEQQQIIGAFLSRHKQ